ncbi:hypothetical protein V6N13_020878 [Hibiscus sabdariffa]
MTRESGEIRIELTQCYNATRDADAPRLWSNICRRLLDQLEKDGVSYEVLKGSESVSEIECCMLPFLFAEQDGFTCFYFLLPISEIEIEYCMIPVFFFSMVL